MSSFNNSKKILSLYEALSSQGLLDENIIDLLVDVLNSKHPSHSLNRIPVLRELNLKNSQIDLVALVELIGLTHQEKKEKSKISNTNARKHHGIYYTDYSIAELITKETLATFDEYTDFTKLSFLEPCSGTGIFAIAYLNNIFRVANRLGKAQEIINNMFFADIDDEAIALLKIIIPAYLKAQYQIKVKIPNKNLFVGDALFKVNNLRVEKNDLKNIFLKKEGFDIVITNPPYKLLKANSNKYNSETDDYRKQINSTLSFIRNNKTYKYNTGTLNLYKLFTEEILEKLTKNDAKIGLLIPATVLSDKYSFELRERIMSAYTLSTIHSIPEKNDFFNGITQAFCFFSVDKRKSSEYLKFKMNISNSGMFNSNSIRVKKSLIKSISTFQEIISTDKIGWNILSKMHKHKKIKEIPSIINLRGELDLTLDKSFITDKQTEYPLLRGNGVKEFVFEHDKSYVHDSFVKKLNGKGHFLKSSRIVCQQVSNMNLKKRLKFSKVSPNTILGNSCNFISLNNENLFQEDVSLNFLLAVLNSKLLNWRFQLTNSNNHIGNYELDELPLVIPNKKQKMQLEAIASKLLLNPNDHEIMGLLNSFVFNLYELNDNEISYIDEKYASNKVAVSI